jgi:hypothetical protein
MTIGTDERTGVAAERVHWPVEVGGRSYRLDLIPGVLGRRSVVFKIDGRAINRMAAPTPQVPWREAHTTIAGESVVIGLTWHFPVMHTDVFVGGRSLRDGRTLDSVRGDTPRAMTNYEVWLGGLFRVPFFGSRPRSPRFATLLVAIAAAVWIVALFATPFPPEWRGVVAAVLAATGIVLMLSFVWSWLVVAERLHRALLARPRLGNAARVLAFFTGFVAYPIVALFIVVLGLGLVLLSRWGSGP